VPADIAFKYLGADVVNASIVVLSGIEKFLKLIFCAYLPDEQIHKSVFV
jgi:hypothetical protein